MERESKKILRFSSLEEFVDGSNNFVYHFLEGKLISSRRREKEYYTQFKQIYPELEGMTTKSISEYFENHKTLSGIYKDYERMNLLYESYNKIVDLIDEKIECDYPEDLLIR